MEMFTVGPLAFILLTICVMIIFVTFVKHYKDEDEGPVIGIVSAGIIFLIGSVVIGFATCEGPPGSRKTEHYKGDFIEVEDGIKKYQIDNNNCYTVNNKWAGCVKKEVE